MKLEKNIRNAIIAGLFIVPFIPLIVTNSLFFPFITGKAFTFRIIVEIVFALWLVLCLLDKNYRPKFSWINVALFAFVAIVFVADLLGMNPLKSIWSNYERMEGFVTIFHLWLYFIVTSSVFIKEKIWETYFNTSIGVSLMLIVYGFSQLAGKSEIHQGSTRLDATLGNSAYFAVYLIVLLFLTLFMLWKKRHNVPLRFTYGIVAVLQVIILYYTGTRGSILGLIGGVFLGAILMLIFFWKNKKIRNTGLIIGAVIILLIGGFESVKDKNFVKQSPVLSRLAAINASDAAPRLLIWKMAYEGFKEKPILGWGQENYNYVFNKYYDPKLFAQEQWFDRAHNVFFDWLTAGGILALVSYLSLFAVALYYLWRKSEHFTLMERIIFTSLLAAYFIHNLFVFDNLISYILFFTLLAFFHSKNEGKPVRAFQSIKFHKDIENLVIFPLIGVVLVVSLYEVNVKPMWASTALIQAISPQKNGPQDNINYFKKALAYNTFANQEIREQLIGTSEQISNSNASTEVKQAFFNLTKSEMDKWIKEAPQDARAYIFMGSFLDRFGLYADANPYLVKAVELSPTKQSMLYELGSNYLALGKTEEGFEALKKAYTLEPSNNEAKVNYAVGAIYAGKKDIANELMKDQKDLMTTDQRFINAYASIKDFKTLLSIYSEKLKTNPRDTQLRVSMAAVYFAMGNKGAAIDQIQTAINQNPSFKEEGDYYINQIETGKNP